MEAETRPETSNGAGDSHNANNGTVQSPEEPQEMVLTIKKPHRVLHFSDGTWEENSDEDEADGNKKNEETAVADPSTLTWVPWFAYQATYMGSKTLEVCDYLGEKLAAFFGITTPKYQYVIDEYNRMLEQEKQTKKEMDVEMGGWVNTNQPDAVSAQPKVQQTLTLTPPPAEIK